jgi:spermidine synthase
MTPRTEPPRTRRLTLVIIAVFSLSGATSLVYQVAWLRMLSLFFGSDVFAASITLSVFMGGLSLGGLFAGSVGDRVRRPLVAYGACEVGVALFAFAVPHLLSAFHDTYQAVYRQSFGQHPMVYEGFRLLVAGAALLGPTILMGATLPLVVRQLGDRSEVLGRRVGLLYAANTLGAVLGTVASGFVALPLSGVAATVHAALAINLGIGVVAMALGLRLPPLRPAEPTSLPISPTGSGPGFSPRQAAAAWVIGVSGFAAMALEVVWMRVLVRSFSATVYAFSIMLASFLFGIFQGSRNAARVADDKPDALAYLGRLELWIGAMVAGLAIVIYLVPTLFGVLVWGLTAVSRGAFGVASVAVQFVVAMGLIAWPTLLLGETFPIAVKVFTVDIDRRAQGTGVIYAANTAGALLGSLFGGLAMLPLFGMRGSLVVIALLFVAAGMIAARASASAGSSWRQDPTRGAVALTAALSVLALALPRQVIVNFGLQKSTRPKVLFQGEGVSHGVDIVKSANGNTVMMIDGNIEADTTHVQRRHFILKGHLPLILQPDAHDTAVVGLGLGITLGATDRDPGARTIRLVELTPEMVAAHRVLPELSHGLLDSPKLKLRVDDARNFMAMTDERFDMVTADPIHPRITGVGYLYTREYYELIKQRLRPGGIVVQWMPMYQISPRSFDVAFRTFAGVFPNSTFWYVRGHGLFVATAGDMRFDWAKMTERIADPAVREDLASIQIDSLEGLFGYLLMDAPHIARYLARDGGGRENTDDNGDLEYHTPFEYLGRTDAIVEALLPYAGWDVDRLLSTAPPDSREKVHAAFDERLRRMPAELKEPIE